MPGFLCGSAPLAALLGQETKDRSYARSVGSPSLLPLTRPFYLGDSFALCQWSAFVSASLSPETLVFVSASQLQINVS